MTAVVVVPAELLATELPAPAPAIPQPRAEAPQGAARMTDVDGQIQPGQTWNGWWTPTRLPTVEAPSRSGAPVCTTPAGLEPAAPRPSPAAPLSAGSSSPGQLKRRVPQANLAPALRRSSPAGEAVITEPLPARGAVTGDDAQRAWDALSRFQASRLAALQEQVEAGSRSGL